VNKTLMTSLHLMHRPTLIAVPRQKVAQSGSSRVCRFGACVDAYFYSANAFINALFTLGLCRLFGMFDSSGAIRV